MAAIDSPRRILGDRDVNKPVFKSPSAIKASPLNPSPFLIKPGLRENGLNMGHLAKVLLCPEVSAEVGPTSPLSDKKRGLRFVEDAEDRPLRKQAAREDANERATGTSKRVQMIARRVVYIVAKATDALLERMWNLG